jgi:hypothetical protein
MESPLRTFSISRNVNACNATPDKLLKNKKLCSLFVERKQYTVGVVRFQKE